MWPAPSLTLSTTFESKVFTATFPVQTPLVKAVVAAGDTASAPPVPLAERAGVPA